MAAYTRRTVTTVTEVWELETPAAFVEVSKVLNSIAQFLDSTEHPARDYDDACLVTVGDDRVIFTVTVPPGGAA